MKCDNIDFNLSDIRNAKVLSRDSDSMEVVIERISGGISLEGVNQTDKRYLTGFITVLEKHSFPLTVRFFVPGIEEERAYIRFVLLPEIRTRVCFDLNWLDMNTGGLHRTPGTLKQVIHGSRTELRNVERVEIGSREAFKDVHLLFDHFMLTDQMPVDYPLSKETLVDEFGQYKKKEWPGKIHNLQELKEAFCAVSGKGEYPFDNWSKWGGDTDRKLCEGTGFFSTHKTADCRWHLVDPDGFDYFSMSVCCTHVENMGDFTGQRQLLDWLPDVDDDMYKLFYRERMHPWYPEMMEQFNFTGANLYKIYGDIWEEKWKEITYHILMGSGINSQGNSPGLDINNGKSKIPYVRQIPDFPTTTTVIFRDFPDVLSPEYSENSEAFAQKLREWKDDPWLIGYFMRNEPGFNFIPDVNIANEVLFNPEFTYCKKGLIQFLQDKYQRIEDLNRVWDAAFTDFHDLEQPIQNCVAEYPQSQADLREYSLFLVREYCRIPSQACRRVDPNHLNLGLRWSRMNNPDMLAGWEYMDVFSFNCYSFDPLQDMNFVSNAGVDLPIMIGEFHCGALDRGLTATGLKGVTSQEERGIMWRQFMEKCAAHPNGVGAHWFQYSDEFCLGRLDGENYQIGIVDICLQPYKEMVEAVKETSSVIYQVKNGEKEPFLQMPEIIPMVG